MSVSSLLEQIQKRGKIVSRSPGAGSSSASSQKQENRPENTAKTASSSQPSQRQNRPVDPVVARLKEARRLEMEQKEAARNEARKQTTKKIGDKKSSGSLGSRTTSSSASAKNSGPKPQPRTLPGAPNAAVALESRKKVNYKELMKKATTIDNSKLSLKIKAKSLLPPIRPHSRTERPASHTGKSSPSTAVSSTSQSAVSGRQLHSTDRQKTTKYDPQNGSKNGPKNGSKKPELSARPLPRALLPVRQPSAKLSQSLSSRRTNDEEDDSDMLSFLASDDEEEQNQDYDRDEIWAMFNRGKKRADYERYDDYDSDDMEATGAEILDEEMRSKRRAELEDRREMEEELRLKALKRQRKQKKD